MARLFLAHTKIRLFISVAVLLGALVLHSESYASSSSPGSASNVSRLAVSSAHLAFNDVALGNGTVKTITLTNRGASSVVLSSVDRSNPAFSLRNIKLPYTIVPGGTVNVQVAFTPYRPGPTDGYLTLRTPGLRNGVFHVTGRGLSTRLIARPSSLNFGTVPLGAMVRLPVTISNIGSATQTIKNLGMSGAEFNVIGFNGPMTLPPGHSVTFTTAFIPTNSGRANAKLNVGTAAYELPIPLAGNAIPGARLSISPANLNFGNVKIGATEAMSGTLRAGSGKVVVYSAAITSPEFAMSGLSFPLVLNPGQSKSFSLTFTPRSRGTASAALSFQSSGPSARVIGALAGTGTAASLHNVTLSWTASSNGVIGYNIYRADRSGGPYSKLNAVPDSTTRYLDSALKSGQSYYYVTTSITANGTQSGFSDQIEVDIP